MEIIKHSYKWKNTLTKRKSTKKIILHCSATPEGKDFTVEDIHRWHLQRGFSGIGYHFIIYRDGSIHEGRPIEMSGAHCSGYNSTSIGICYIGGVDSKNAPKDTRTQEQKEALYEIVKYILEKYNLTLDNLFCHNQLGKKACPSFKIEDFKNEFKKYFNL